MLNYLLFTKISVIKTIDGIINAVKYHLDLLPPPIKEELLKKLLLATETLFIFNNQTYIQINGILMGSALGFLFAYFYMLTLKNKIREDNKADNLHFLRSLR